MMALVLGVMAASIVSGQMHLVLGQQSTRTAVAPAIQMASAVGAVAQTDGVFGAVVGGEFGLEAFQHRALNVVTAQQHFLDVGVNFFLDVLVLANMAVEFNFHKPETLTEDAPVTRFFLAS